jgi:hypothetical protein
VSVDLEAWVGAGEVARFLSTSKSFVLGLALRRQIPCLSLPSSGGKRQSYRFRLGDVARWAESRARGKGRSDRRP